MGEPPPIPIESRVTREPEPTDAGDGAHGRSTSGRVVHEPGRWPRLAAVVAIAGLVAGGLVWTLSDGDSAPPDDGAASEPSIPPDDPQAETRTAFARAVLRFRGVDSFAYRGSVRVRGTLPFESSAWTAGDVTVEGAVLLQHGLTRDVAVDDHGRAVETLTSGTTVWSRTARDASALGGAAWEVRTAPSAFPAVVPGEVRTWGVLVALDGRLAAAPGGLLTVTGFPLDAATVTRLVLSAGDPRGEAPDAAGRRVIRATLPERGRGVDEGLLLGGADVLLTLDERGDVVRLMVTWPAVDPQLVLDLEISGHNDPQHIAPPDSGPTALRRTVPVADLEAAGVRPLDLGLVPAGWRLTSVWVQPQDGPPAMCPMLALRYGDPDAVSGRYLLLRMTSEDCGGWFSVPGTRRQLTVGAFEGSVVMSSASTIIGTVFDGTTAVSFDTDLAVEDLTDLLASLRPFDPAAEPNPLPAASR